VLFLATFRAKRGDMGLTFVRFITGSEEHATQQGSAEWVFIIEEAAQEELARNNEEVYWQHMEFLAAYVRKKVPWRETSQSYAPAPCAPEILAILTVLGRREKTACNGGQRWLNLRRTDLRGVALPNANLQGLDLTSSHLEEANLWGADLRGVLLPRAHLERAFLANAHLEGANLVGAHLEEAFLREGHLRGTLLTGAHLERAILWTAHLEQANLWGAHLERADLWGANLQGANLAHATGLTAEQVAVALIDEETQLPNISCRLIDKRERPRRDLNPCRQRESAFHR
jgi:uncharacterized protein YjbI with pentapeptide repeats